MIYQLLWIPTLLTCGVLGALSGVFGGKAKRVTRKAGKKAWKAFKTKRARELELKRRRRIATFGPNRRDLRIERRRLNRVAQPVAAKRWDAKGPSVREVNARLREALNEEQLRGTTKAAHSKGRCKHTREDGKRCNNKQLVDAKRGGCYIHDKRR